MPDFPFSWKIGGDETSLVTGNGFIETAFRTIAEARSRAQLPDAMNPFPRLPCPFNPDNLRRIG